MAISRPGSGRSLRPRPVSDQEVGAEAPRVLRFAGTGSLAVDGGTVRRRIGAWISGLPVAERPNVEATWRHGILVCDRVLTMARGTLGAADRPPWTVDVHVPSDARELARGTGLGVAALRRTIEALIGAEVLDGAGQIGEDRVVRLRPEILVDAPVLAAIRWDVVGELLGPAEAPVARLVVRELAHRTSIEARARGHFVSASQRELADAVGYSKASMRRHLDALVAVGVIASRSRDRTNSWHRLESVVFDGAMEAGDVATPAPAVSSSPLASGGRASPTRRAAIPARETEVPGAAAAGTSLRGASVVATEQPAVDARPLLAPSAPNAAPAGRSLSASAVPVPAALTIEVNGVRVALPPGVELTLEQDASGALWYRAGGLRLGPVRFT
jgi:DNA-binding transcriptional ArsR family regulator